MEMIEHVFSCSESRQEVFFAKTIPLRHGKSNIITDFLDVTQFTQTEILTKDITLKKCPKPLISTRFQCIFSKLNWSPNPLPPNIALTYFLFLNLMFI